MKKSTGVLLLLTFFFIVVVAIGLFVTMMLLVMQGSTPNLLGSSRLALIRVEGVIYDAEEWIDQVKEYQEDSSVKGIVLRVVSPGGAVDPSQALYQALVEAQEKYGKVVVASFGSVAASGGYYVACNADQIVASPGSLTGSIGVYSKFPVAKELMDKIGVAYETVKAGEYKDFGAMDRGLSPKERAMMQAVIDDTYAQFVEAVLEGRRAPLTRFLESWTGEEAGEYPYTDDIAEIVQAYQTKRINEREAAESTAANSPSAASPTVSSATPDDATAGAVIQEATSDDISIPTPDRETLFALAKAMSEGKVYTGRQALKIGLVDKLGTLEDAINLTAKMVGIRGEPTVIERKQREYTLLDYLTEGLSNLTGTHQQIHSPLQYKFPY